MDLINQDENTWLLLHTDQGKPYYYNRAKKVTQWEKPDTGTVVDLTELAEKATVSSSSSSKTKPSVESNNGSGISSSTVPLDQKEEASTANAEVPTEEVETNEPRVRRSSIGSRRRARKRWTKMKTATFGTSSAEDNEDNGGNVYYLNNETGESQWQRPDEYFSDDEIDLQERLEAINFDLEAPMMDSFTDIGIMSREAQEDCAEMVSDGTLVAMGKCQDRLDQLLLLVQHVGSEAEWDALIIADDFELPRLVFQHWTENTEHSTYQIRVTVCQLLLLFSKLQPSLLPRLVAGQWAPEALFAQQVETGISEARKLTDPHKQDVALNAYLELLQGVLSECQEYGLAEEQLPSRSLLVTLFDIMVVGAEDVFLNAAGAVMAVNMHLLPEDIDDPYAVSPLRDPQSILLQVIHEHPKTEYFGEAILHLLNAQHYPYDNEVQLKQLLKMLQTFLRYENTADFLYTNDLMVLVDIIILELADLPPEDYFRWEYLRLLHLMLLNTSWAKNGRYRRKDLMTVLENIMQAYDSGMNPSVLTLVQAVLTDCIDLLE